MAMKKVPLTDATAAQLRTFLRDAQGLQDVKDNATKVQLTAQLQAVWDQDYIFVNEEAVDTSLPARRSAKQNWDEETDENHPEKVVVHVQIMPEVGGDRPVEVAVNGRNLLIPRGEDVEISWPYWVALKHSVAHFYDQAFDDKGREAGINPVARQVPRYPFQRVA